MKQTIILGNIITMDEKRPFAKAALVRDGVFAYIGGAEEAKKNAGDNAQLLDYGENFIYPGFLEAHTHGFLAGCRAIGQTDLPRFLTTDYAKYREAVNTVPATFEDAKNAILAWQEFAFSNGFTGAADAGADIFFPEVSKVYHELEEEGKLKLRTYAYLMAPDNPGDPKAEVARIAEERTRYSEEYYHIIGVKVFLDGVVEAHTAWMIEDYADQPGCRGRERFNDQDKMVELIAAADEEGLAVHAHSVGNGATQFMLDCIEDAEKITGDKDQRNVLAHLQIVTEEDTRRMSETGSIPAVAPLWMPKDTFETEAAYIGEKLAANSYPIRSFYDSGANVVFHSNFPVSPLIDIRRSIYRAEVRANPEEESGGLASQRNPEEGITREQSLRAMTINVARQYHEEHRLGTIEFGKIANMTVFDCDFLHDEADKVLQANLVATLVDGEEVYKA